jgi:thiol-disulfide isomerase/thioredoxin
LLSFLVIAALASHDTASPSPPPPPPPAAERRVVEYLNAHVRPGEPVVASRLYNEVFTAPEERAALDRLFNIFFKIPLFLAQQQKAAGRPPTLAQITEQFDLAVPGEADVLLRIMQADPRMPGFLERDAASGEIARVDVRAVLAHPRFGKALERTIAGWEGRPAPAFSAVAADGGTTGTAALAGRPYLVYFWFSRCPPCARTAPLLPQLEAGVRGLAIVALNADSVLELPVREAERAAYARQNGWQFSAAAASAETLEAFGSVSVFPTFFFVDRRGVIARQLVNYQPLEALLAAARQAAE